MVCEHGRIGNNLHQSLSAYGVSPEDAEKKTQYVISAMQTLPNDIKIPRRDAAEFLVLSDSMLKRIGQTKHRALWERDLQSIHDHCNALPNDPVEIPGSIHRLVVAEQAARTIEATAFWNRMCADMLGLDLRDSRDAAIIRQIVDAPPDDHDLGYPDSVVADEVRTSPLPWMADRISHSFRRRTIDIARKALAYQREWESSTPFSHQVRQRLARLAIGRRRFSTRAISGDKTAPISLPRLAAAQSYSDVRFSSTDPLTGLVTWICWDSKAAPYQVARSMLDIGHAIGWNGAQHIEIDTDKYGTVSAIINPPLEFVDDASAFFAKLAYDKTDVKIDENGRLTRMTWKKNAPPLAVSRALHMLGMLTQGGEQWAKVDYEANEDKTMQVLCRFDPPLPPKGDFSSVRMGLADSTIHVGTWMDDHQTGRLVCTVQTDEDDEPFRVEVDIERFFAGRFRGPPRQETILSVSSIYGNPQWFREGPHRIREVNEVLETLDLINPIHDAVSQGKHGLSRSPKADIGTLVNGLYDESAAHADQMLDETPPQFSLSDHWKSLL